MKVFVHLVAPDALIIAQHDGLPANWERPTTGWVAGEYVVDVHALEWLADYCGTAQQTVGLYAPETGERLLWDTGQDVLSLGNFMIE